MKKIKIAICINDFLVGGAQRLLADMLHRLDREQFEPVLITLFYWPDRTYFYDLLPLDVPVYRLAFSGFWDLRSFLRLCRLLKSIAPEIVLSNLFFTNTMVRLLKPLLRFKVIIVEHNTYVKKTKLHQLIDRTLAHLSVRIVAVSSGVAAFTAQQEHIPLSKFIVIHNGVDIEALRRQKHTYNPIQEKQLLGLSKDTKVILAVARLTTQKNPELLIESFALFARTHPSYALVIVGGGGKWDISLRTKAETLGISDRVVLAGVRKDIARFYAIADFFVSTSSIEGFGIAHAEALACGVPVLTTKTAGPDEMIQEGENGFFIQEGTPENVVAGMERMVSGDLSHMSRRATEIVEAYSIGRAVEKYEDLFRETARK